MSKPFETTFATLRRGAASMEATEAMQQVVKSVYETGKPAKLVIELTVKPNTKNGGMVEAVIVTDKITTRIPQEAGQSVLFVNSKWNLFPISTAREIYSRRSEKQKERRLILMTTA